MTNYLYRGKQIKTGEWKYGTLDIFLDDKDDLLYHIRRPDKITNAFQASTVDSKTVSKCIDYTGDCQPPRPTANALKVGACKSSD